MSSHNRTPRQTVSASQYESIVAQAGEAHARMYYRKQVMA